eukprot:SAG31_NODE_6579_length_1964_cov_5.426273_1_plen_80_part_00
MYFHLWIARAQHWQTLIAEWDDGDLETVVPRGDDMFPMAGLLAVIEWAIDRSQTRQKELIGKARPTTIAPSVKNAVLSS